MRSLEDTMGCALVLPKSDMEDFIDFPWEASPSLSNGRRVASMEIWGSGRRKEVGTGIGMRKECLKF